MNIKYLNMSDYKVFIVVKIIFSIRFPLNEDNLLNIDLQTNAHINRLKQPPLSVQTTVLFFLKPS